MRLLFCQGGERWKCDENGHIYTSGSFDERIWQRYSKYCEHLTVMFAEDRTCYKENELKEKYNLFDEKKYEKIAVVDVLHPRKNYVDYRIRQHNQKVIEQAVECADVVIIRSLGTYLTNTTFRVAEKKHKKVILEVTGFVFEGNWYSGKLSKFFALQREITAKKYNKKGKYTLYVTEEAMQKRYKNSGINVGISDVFIENMSEEILANRINRILVDRAEKIILGTAGDVSLSCKGHKYVLSALKILQDKGYKNFEYHLAGGGNRNILLRQAEKMGIGDKLIFDGNLPASKMKEWYDMIDIYVCASLTEGLCRAVVEAMSRACPVICSDVGGNYELASRKFLFPKKNSKILADLIKTISSKDIQVSEAKRSYKHALKYRSVILDKKRDDFYMGVLNE